MGEESVLIMLQVLSRGRGKAEGSCQEAAWYRMHIRKGMFDIISK